MITDYIKTISMYANGSFDFSKYFFVVLHDKYLGETFLILVVRFWFYTYFCLSIHKIFFFVKDRFF